MDRGGLLADEEGRPDLAVGPSLDQQRQHLALPGAQAGRGRAGWPPVCGSARVPRGRRDRGGPGGRGRRSRRGAASAPRAAAPACAARRAAAARPPLAPRQVRLGLAEAGVGGQQWLAPGPKLHCGAEPRRRDRSVPARRPASASPQAPRARIVRPTPMSGTRVPARAASRVARWRTPSACARAQRRRVPPRPGHFGQVRRRP